MRNHRNLRALSALTSVLLLTVALAGMASATHVSPTFVAGNPTCGDLVTGQSGEFKIDSGDIGTSGTHGDANFSVDVTFHSSGGEWTSFDFENADPAVMAVYVKAGNGGNLYEYNPPVTADDGLVAPDGKEISHISFCYVTTEPDPSPTPTPDPSPTPTPDPSPTPTPDPSPTPTPDPEPSPTPPPTSMLDEMPGGPTTGMALLLVALLAGGLLVLRPAQRVSIRNR